MIDTSTAQAIGHRALKRRAHMTRPNRSNWQLPKLGVCVPFKASLPVLPGRETVDALLLNDTPCGFLEGFGARGAFQ
ncbi:MAG TPA: hypothetical protein VHO25_07825 [Polyangiaceae bacterium]|nr:hypothetical protein [Polyangiaceae bacterium]